MRQEFFGMRRANGDWFAMEIESQKRVPVFRSLGAACESVDATRRSVEMAREYLRACLVEAGVKIAQEERKEATAS